MPTDTRAELERLMRATLADNAQHHDWTYAAVRPLPVPPSWHKGQHVRADCSFGVKDLCKWAGVKDDPTGSNYDGYGNSSTIAAHLKHLGAPGELLIGDVVTFGSDGSNAHAAMVLERGSDPLLWSHGHQGAPNTYRLSQDGRPHLYCRLNVPAYVPTPNDRLRARTGYWSWVQWRLGEGHWCHKKPMDKTVRPNVPAVVSPLWWKNYALFLAGRKKGNKAKGPVT